jgi:hypothetical protein
MHGLPENIDLDFFSGLAILQVCIGENELILNFESDVSILVMSELEFCSPNAVAHRSSDFREMAGFLCSLIGLKAVSATPQGRRAMQLLFDGGKSLTLHDDSENYESFVITRGKLLIVV